jgi:DNA polymerase-3 subunit alpha
LIQSGALDSLHGNRAQLLESIDLATMYSQRAHVQRVNGQRSIFDMSNEKVSLDQPALPDVKSWSSGEQLSREKEMLGFYFSGHPLGKFKLEIQMFSRNMLDQLHSLPDKAPVKMGAIITGIKKHFDRKNRPMAFVNIEDLTGTGEMIVFADAFETYNQILHVDSMVLINGKVSSRGDSEENKILCDELIPLNEVWDRCVKTMSFSLETSKANEGFIREIKEVLATDRGRCPIYINIKTPDNGEYVIKSRKITARPSPKLVNRLSDMIGVENIWIES